jgi:hypothetical protein
MQARKLQIGTLGDRVRGGKARARNLSPERRSEIACWARLVRGQKDRGEFSSAEFVKRFVARLRSFDPDLATFVKAAHRLPIKYQKNMCSLLSSEEQETLQRVHDEVLKEGF